MNHLIRIGTRGSQLALVQARWVRARLQELFPDRQVELVIIKTSGDRFVDRPLSTIGGKGLFVKEIEEALAAGSVDCAVHSMKDVPAALLDGLTLAAVPAREDPRDAILARAGATLATLPPGARLGTSSLRRMALVRAARPDVEVLPLRGNVDTRLRKLDNGELDAIVLAAAGLRRLGIERPDIRPCEPDAFLPAIGQGALALESRADDSAALLAPLDHQPTRCAVMAERAFMLRVGGSCHTPLAAHATLAGDALSLRALIANPNGSEVIRGQCAGPSVDAVRLGAGLADELLARGGSRILAALDEAARPLNAR